MLALLSFGSYKNVIDIIAKTQISISDVTTNTHTPSFYFITIFSYTFIHGIVQCKEGCRGMKNFSVRKAIRDVHDGTRMECIFLVFLTHMLDFLSPHIFIPERFYSSLS